MGKSLSYVEHRAYVRRVIRESRKDWSAREDLVLASISRLDRFTLAVVWLTVILDLPNGTTLYYDEFQDNLRLRFGLETLGLQKK